MKKYTKKNLVMTAVSSSVATAALVFGLTNAFGGVISANFTYNCDVNGDGKVNTIDVNRVYAHVKGTNLLTGYAFSCANVIGTGETVNTIDVNRIYAHVKGTNLLW